MSRTKVAGWLAIIILASPCFAKDAQLARKLTEIKTRLSRPTIVGMPAIHERRGITASERELLDKKYSPDIRKEIEATINYFWNVDLLRAMAAAGSVSFEDSRSRHDDWLYRIDVTDDRLGCGLPVIAEKDRIQLTFLSAAGFKRIEDSRELVGATGRDLFAGVPVADFCERKPGSRVPVDYALKFSPWDVASQLASSSRLEVSLVNLILKPDGLAIDKEWPESKDHPTGGAGHHDHGWLDALDRLDAQIKTGSLNLADLANLTRRDNAIEVAVRSMILAAAVNAPSLRRDCSRRMGNWSEVKWIDGSWLELFSCRTTSRDQTGFSLVVEDGDLAEGTIILSTVSGSFRIEAKLDGNTDEFSIRYSDPAKLINSEMWLTKDGAVRAMRDSSAQGSRHVFFDKSGRAEWINQMTEFKNLQNVSWYRGGQPKSFQVTDDEGRVLGRGGFYESGNPMFWVAYQGGKKDGKLQWWFPGGALAGELDYAAGKRFGIGSVFYENGVEGFHGEYSDDQLHGRMIWRDPSNRSLFSTGYVSGKAHGLLEIRHGGRTIAEARFHGGTVEGTVVVRNDKGIIVGEIPYQSGLLDGDVILRDNSGSVRVISKWNEGQLDAETDVWYSSKVKAATCTFDDGHLIEWSSFRPDSKLRYSGKVISSKDGKAVIEYYGGGAAPTLRCTTVDWNLEDCESIHSGRVRSAPRLPDFAKSLSLNQRFRFVPEKCGGYSQSFDVSPFADLVEGDAQISFRVKDACKGVGLATSIRCKASLNSGSWSINGCESTSSEDREY